MIRGNAKFYSLTRRYFEGDTTPGGAGGDTLPGGAGNGGAGNGKTFTQEDVDKMMAANKRSLQQQVAQLTAKVQELSKSSTATAEEKAAIQQQLDNITQEFQTKEQRILGDYEKLQNKYKTETESLTAETKTWRSRFEQNLVQRAIVDAAAGGEAFNPSQMVRMLSRDARVVETTVDGKPTGEFEVRINFEGVDAKGKPQKLDLTAAETVKAMREMPNVYGNLFKNGATGGVGGTNNGGNTSNIDISKLTPEQYRASRENIHNQMAKQD